MNPFVAKITDWANKNPTGIAVSKRGRGGVYAETTWEQLLVRVRQFATFPSRETIVPLMLDRDADCVSAMLGILASGRTFTCLNPKLKTKQILQILQATNADTVLIDGTGLQMLKEDMEQVTNLSHVTWRIINESTLKRPQQKLLEKLRACATVESWHPTADPQDVKPVSNPSPHGACVFTSGSTGVPKGVLVLRDDLVDRVQNDAQMFEMKSDDVCLAALPFSFDVGITQVFSSLWSGSELTILDSWFPKNILDATAERNVNGIQATPAIWANFLANDIYFDRQDAHRSLRYISVSGADLLPKQLTRLPDIVDGAQIFKTYGQSENYRSTILLAHDFVGRETSVGKALPGVTLYVVDGQGRPVPAGTVGEIVHVGTGAMGGYINSDDSQKRRSNPFAQPLAQPSAEDEDSVAIFTGDNGYLDQDGYLYLAGREDDMIKINGNRVYPQEVSALMMELPDVVDSIALGVTDADGQKTLVGFIVPRAESAPLPETEYQRAMGGLAPSYMCPTRILVRSGLPTNGASKVDRQLLIEEAKQALAEALVEG